MRVRKVPRGMREPARDVEEPLREALGWLVVESTAAFALVAIAVASPTIIPLDGTASDAVHLAGPMSLGIWVIASWLLRTFRARPDVLPSVAWDRARRADPGEAVLAVAIALVSTIAVGVAFAVIVRFYFLEPGMRATTITVLLPALIALYLAVIATGIHNLTDRLARAMGESESRFRAYWRQVAEHHNDPA